MPGRMLDGIFTLSYNDSENRKEPEPVYFTPPADTTEQKGRMRNADRIHYRDPGWMEL